MVARVWITDHRRVWITGLVALAHAAAFSWILFHRIALPGSIQLETFDVTFAELEPELKSEPVAAPEPVSLPQPAPAAQPVLPAPEPPPLTAPQALPSQPVLTQLETVETAEIARQEASPEASSDVLETTELQQIATALQAFDCRRLKSRADERCPKPDPFEMAAASQARQETAPRAALLVGDYGPKSILEGLMSQKDKDPFLFPGMDGDLFSEGMAPGAYNAQRIRNGQAPLWDRKIEDGFRKPD